MIEMVIVITSNTPAEVDLSRVRIQHEKKK